VIGYAICVAWFNGNKLLSCGISEIALEENNYVLASGIPAYISLLMLLAIPAISAIRSERKVKLLLACCPCPMFVWFVLWVVDSGGFRQMWGSAPWIALGSFVWYFVVFATIKNWEAKRYFHRLVLLAIFVGPLLFVEYMGWALSGEWYLGVANQIEKSESIQEAGSKKPDSSDQRSSR
jgi:hypothetical protein